MTAHHALDRAEKPATFDGPWASRIVAPFADHDVVNVKVRREFVWQHPTTATARVVG